MSLWRFVQYTFNGLDMSSAANDVIVVRHRDGSLRSSPFQVRFGKFKLMRPQDKVVAIEVNGTLTKAVMKIGHDGEAFWLEPTDEAPATGRAESPVDPLSSPMLRQQDAGSPTTTIPGLSLTTSEEGLSSPHRGIAAKGGRSDAPAPEEALPQVDIREPISGATDAPKVDELVEVLGEEPPPYERSVGETGEPMQRSTTDMFTQDMSDEERQKYTDLLKSLQIGDRQEGGPARGLTLAKFASIEELSDAVVCSSDGTGIPLVTVGIPMEACTPTSLASSSSPPPASLAAPHTAADRNPGESAERLANDVAAAATGDRGAAEEVSSTERDDVEEYDEEGDEYEEDYEEDANGVQVAREPVPSVRYFVPTQRPLSVDLEKLNLRAGHNSIRYITHSSIQGKVVVESSIFLWASDAKIVVSDIDGTVTKSDIMGHLLPLIGRDWTHPGICSLYSKVARNGYEFVYLTARSMAQQQQTKRFLWGIEQDGVTLPRGPVLTAPDRFFTALTQEVSKRAHEFKITCLKGIQDAFPRCCKPFYAGFGNRMGDIISYTATQIPKHKIFIIDTNSTLHVCRVKQTYKNLAHLVDVTFPPLRPSDIVVTVPPGCVASMDRKSSTVSSSNSAPTSPGLPSQNSAAGAVPPAPLRATPIKSKLGDGGMHEGESVDVDFNNFNFWRIPPEELLAEQPAPLNSQQPARKGQAAGTGSGTTSHGSSQQHPGVAHPSFVDTLPKSEVSGGAAKPAPAAPQQQKGWLRGLFGGGGKDPQQ